MTLPEDRTTIGYGTWLGSHDIFARNVVLVNLATANPDCLRTRSGAECVSITLSEIEARKAKSSETSKVRAA